MATSSPALVSELQLAIPIIDGDADIWAIFYQPELCNRVLEALAEPLIGNIDVIIGAEARGFALGTALAIHMGIPFAPVRKNEGFLPGKCAEAKGRPDYKGNQHTFRIQRSAIHAGERVVLVDDWIETGNQAMIIKSIVESMGGVFYGVSSIVDQVTPTRKRELGVFHGLITNHELYRGFEQRNYQEEARLAAMSV